MKTNFDIQNEIEFSYRKIVINFPKNWNKIGQVVKMVDPENRAKMQAGDATRALHVMAKCGFSWLGMIRDMPAVFIFI